MPSDVSLSVSMLFIMPRLSLFVPFSFLYDIIRGPALNVSSYSTWFNKCSVTPPARAAAVASSNAPRLRRQPLWDWLTWWCVEIQCVLDVFSRILKRTDCLRSSGKPHHSLIIIQENPCLVNFHFINDDEMKSINEEKSAKRNQAVIAACSAHHLWSSKVKRYFNFKVNLKSHLKCFKK